MEEGRSVRRDEEQQHGMGSGRVAAIFREIETEADAATATAASSSGQRADADAGLQLQVGFASSSSVIPCAFLRMSSVFFPVPAKSSQIVP